MNTDRDSVIDAMDVLNDFAGDLSAGVGVLTEYRIHHINGTCPDVLFIPIQKMCLSHLALTLSKWSEFYTHYHELIPDSLRPVVKQLNKEIQRRNIVHFRNTCVGHLWDKSKGRPLALSEVMARLELMAGGTAHSFLDWLFNPKDNSYPSTVSSIVFRLRDELATIHNIRPEDVINR